MTTMFAIKSALLAALALSSHVNANPLPATHELVTRQGQDRLGAVASESDICSKIGIKILAQGGNAADAHVATTFCIGVVAMYHSGMGGGGFMLVRASNGTYEMIDFRETAPAASTQDMYSNGKSNLSIFGGLASGVPGEVRGLAYLHEHYGSMPWKDVMQPAIDTARNGWNVTKDLVRYMASANASAQVPNFLCAEPAWALDFCPNGTLVGLGDVITRRRYADTLETVANKGPDAFYSGAIADTTIAALQAAGGIMTLQDLANYTIASRYVDNITYGDFVLHATSAPSSGGICLAALNTLSGYEDIFYPDNINLSTSRLNEAMKWAYAARADFGDPLFVPGLRQFEEELLTPEAGAEIRAKISDTQTFNVSYYDPNNIEILNTPGTSQVSTADHTGMAISLTTTVNLLFGSNLIVPETGVIMNNEMNDFSIPNTVNAFGYAPSPNNFIAPGKRPLSSISPVIVEWASNGSLYFVIGAAGGSRITTATMQNLIHVLNQNMSAPEALAQPRMHDQLIPAVVTFEYAYDNETVAFIKSLGSNVSWVAPGQSTAQGVLLTPNGTFQAAGEPRQLNSGGYAI